MSAAGSHSGRSRPHRPARQSTPAAATSAPAARDACIPAVSCARASESPCEPGGPVDADECHGHGQDGGEFRELTEAGLLRRSRRRQRDDVLGALAQRLAPAGADMTGERHGQGDSLHREGRIDEHVDPGGDATQLGVGALRRRRGEHRQCRTDSDREQQAGPDPYREEQDPGRHPSRPPPDQRQHQDHRHELERGLHRVPRDPPAALQNRPVGETHRQVERPGQLQEQEGRYATADTQAATVPSRPTSAVGCETYTSAIPSTP